MSKWNGHRPHRLRHGSHSPRTRPLLVGTESSNPSPSSEESGELDLVDQKRDKALPPENARHDGGFRVPVAITPPSSLQLALHGRGYRPPHYLVPRWRWRWCRHCAGDRAKRAAGCCPDCSAGSAASRSADRRAGPRTDQAAADRSLAGVIGVGARRQTERQRQRNPARSNTKCLSHVLTRSARDCPDNTTRLGQVPLRPRQRRSRSPATAQARKGCAPASKGRKDRHAMLSPQATVCEVDRARKRAVSLQKGLGPWIPKATGGAQCCTCRMNIP